jgi:hypothetical protein
MSPEQDKLLKIRAYTPDFLILLGRLEERLKSVIKVSSFPTYISRVKSIIVIIAVVANSSQ